MNGVTDSEGLLFLGFGDETLEETLELTACLLQTAFLLLLLFFSGKTGSFSLFLSFLGSGLRFLLFPFLFFYLLFLCLRLYNARA